MNAEAPPPGRLYQSYSEYSRVALRPQHIFSLAGVVGAVLLGYFGGRTPKQ